MYGDLNQLNGDNNFMITANSGVQGNGNWLVGNMVNFAGNGLKMFGPDAHPMFWAY